jgi:hypothetical protein
MILLVPNSNDIKNYEYIFTKLKKNKSIIICKNNKIKKSFFDKFIKIKFYLDEKHHGFIIFFLFFIINLFKIFYIFLFYKISKVIVSDDRTGSFILLLLKFCKILKKKSIILTFTNPTTINNLIRSRLNFSHFLSIGQKYGSKKYKNKYVSFYGNAQGNFYNLINILPKDPWKFGNGNSDEILFFDKNSKSLFLSSGVPRKKLKKTEDFILNKIKSDINNFKENKIIFIKKNKLSKSQKIIFFTLTQWFEHKIYSKKIAWEIHLHFIKYLSNKFNKKRFNLVLLLHPKQNLKEYKWLEKKFITKVLKTETETKLIFADLIIIAQNSSIVSLCKKLKIPTIVVKTRNEFSVRKILSKNIKYLKSPNQLLDYEIKSMLSSRKKLI